MAQLGGVRVGGGDGLGCGGGAGLEGIWKEWMRGDVRRRGFEWREERGDHRCNECPLTDKPTIVSESGS